MEFELPTDQQGSDVQEPNTQLETTGQEGVEVSDNPVIDNSDSWESDARFESMWNKDPNQLWKSYKSIEKMYEPTKAELEKIRSDYETLNKTHSEHQPIFDYLNGAYENPHTRGILEAAINQINDHAKREKYGDLPDELIDKLKMGETALKKLEETERLAAEQQKMEAETSAYTDALQNISEFANKNGISWSKEDKAAFIEHAKAQNVSSPHHLKALFYEHAIPAIRNGAVKKAEAATVQSIQKSSAASISAPRVRSFATDATKELSFMDIWNQRQNRS